MGETANKNKILLVDDAKEIQDLVSHILSADYNVVVSPSLADAGFKLKNEHFDLVLLDLGLPDGDGFELFKMAEAKELPVVILSARRETPQKVMGFYLGVEDYIEKPFNQLEFKARIDSRMKKLKQQRMNSLTYRIGPLDFYPDQLSVVGKDGEFSKKIDLTPIEFKLLAILAKSPEQVFSREELISLVRQETPNMVERGIDSHISRLRKKLTKFNCFVSSSYGQGYFFKTGGPQGHHG